MNIRNSTPNPSVFDHAMLWIVAAGGSIVVANMAQFVWRLFP
jgi:hypothetical protein